METSPELSLLQKTIDAAFAVYVDSLVDDPVGPGPVVAWVCVALRYNDGAEDPGFHVFTPSGQLAPLTRGMLSDALDAFRVSAAPD